MEWCVYMLYCCDGTLYTGSTNRLEQRVLAHAQGRGAKYTRSRRPVELIYQETVRTGPPHCAGRHRSNGCPDRKNGI